MAALFTGVKAETTETRSPDLEAASGRHHLGPFLLEEWLRWLAGEAIRKDGGVVGSIARKVILAAKSDSARDTVYPPMYSSGVFFGDCPP